MDKTLIKNNFPINIPFLILEDMDTLRQLMIKDLRSIGVMGVIHEASDVKMAINICKNEEIGFVISDWNLPDGTGHEFLKSFRANLRFKKTPYIMCTTNKEIKFFLDAIASGANDYLVKPWSTEELRKKIQLTWEAYLRKN